MGDKDSNMAKVLCEDGNESESKSLVSLSIVIVNYNVRHFLQQCLLSIESSTIQAELLEVWVVDNASVDASVEMVRQLFPWVKIIANVENLGFARANNLALAAATGKYCLLLNPDTVLQADTLQTCISFLDAHPEVGGLGVQMVDGSGAFLPESKRGLPTPAVAFYKMSGLARLFPYSKVFGKYHLSYLPTHITAEVDVLSGAFMMLRSSTLVQTGLLDETFFMYGEDVDLSYRIQKAGFKNYYLADTRIIHYKGESTKRSSVNYVLVFYKAMHIFAQKHFGKSSAGLYGLLLIVAIYLRAGYSILLRFWWAAYLPLAEGLLIWLGMYGLKEYWEMRAYGGQDWYPPSYMLFAVPAYIFSWGVANAITGGYKRPYILERLFMGIGLGTLIISTGSNFLDQYRYSRALILLGTLLAAAVLVIVRLADNFRLYRRFTLAGQQRQRALIVGEALDVARVRAILIQGEAPVKILGWVGVERQENVDIEYAGQVAELDQLATLFNADEVIFCAASVDAQTIIESMRKLGKHGITFKIMPANADFMLGSAGAQAAGTLYSLDLTIGLAEKRTIWLKRIVDIFLCLILIVISPLVVWLMANKVDYLTNLLDVFIGRKTWVALKYDSPFMKYFSKPGVLSPSSIIIGVKADELTVRRLEVIYAKDYNMANDFALVWSCIKQLDKRPTL